MIIDDIVKEVKRQRIYDQRKLKKKYDENPQRDSLGKKLPYDKVHPKFVQSEALSIKNAFDELLFMIEDMKVSDNPDDRLVSKLLTLEMKHKRAQENVDLNNLIKARLGTQAVGGEFTFSDIGKVFGFSRERARQISEVAERKLKHPAVSRKFRKSIED